MGSLDAAVLPAPTFYALRNNLAMRDRNVASSTPSRRNGVSVQVTGTPGRHPLSAALLAQVLGTVLAACIVLIFRSSLTLSIFSIAALQGFSAMVVAWLMRLPGWWLIIHLVFMPLVVGARGFDLSPWMWFGGFVLLLLIFWRTDTSQVPLYLTNRESGEALLSLLPAKACRVIDIGCGDGALLRHLARSRLDCDFIGIEHAPLTFAWAWLLARGLANLGIRRENIWSHSLQDYAVVYAFLSPAPMSRLWSKAKDEMKPGACLVSNSFAIPGQAPQTIIDVADKRGTRLYVYAIRNQAEN